MIQTLNPRVSLVLVVGVAVLTATCLSSPMQAQVRSGRRAATPAPAGQALGVGLRLARAAGGRERRDDERGDDLTWQPRLARHLRYLPAHPGPS